MLNSLREYKKPTVLTLLLIIGEVLIEVLIPFYTARLVNQIKAGVEMKYVVSLGLVLVVMAVISLGCGGAAGLTGARASAGFAKNLRGDLFRKIQDFSFGNIDRFSTSSLVTRLTTDITYVQMAFMMCIRIAVRAPLMLLFSIVMAFLMGGMLAVTFVVVIPILVLGLLLIARKAMPAFHAVFRKYDRMNEAIEENVRAMRVVKGFARENYEKEKFSTASDNIRRDFTYAERVVALNGPIMQFCLYFNMIFILFVGFSDIETAKTSSYLAMFVIGIPVFLTLPLKGYHAMYYRLYYLLKYLFRVRFYVWGGRKFLFEEEDDEAV